MSAPNNHPEIDELVDWARGDLSRKRLREIRAHCRSCPACDMKLAKILVLRTKQRREMKRAARRRRHLQMAAAIVLLVGVGAVFLFSGYFSDPAMELASLATTETIPGSQIILRFRPATSASADLYEYKLKAGMEALVRGDYSFAEDTLGGLYGEHPESSEVAAYWGVARYLSGNDSDHTKTLLATGASDMQNMIRRTATWYLANSCLRSGESDSAIQLLQSPDLNGVDVRYGRYAEELLRKIREAQDS